MMNWMEKRLVLLIRLATMIWNKQQEEIFKKIYEDIRGSILEDTVFSQFAKEIESLGKKNNPYAISKYRNAEAKK